MTRRRLMHMVPVPLTVTLILYVISHVMERALAVLPWDMDLQWSGIRLTVLVIAAPVYGIYRVVAFHPGARPAYRQFLARSPWKWGQPLPLGPIHLTWRDLIFLAGLVGLIFAEEKIAGPTLLATPSGIFPDWILPAAAMFLFAAGYLTCLWFSIREDKVTAVVVAFIVPLAVYPCFNVWVAATTVVLIYLLLLVGLRRTLGRFPWNEPDWVIAPPQRYLNEAMRGGVIGRPYRSLGPSTNVPGIPPQMAVVLAALAAWWFHAFLGIFIHADMVSSLRRNGLGQAITWEYFAASLQGLPPAERNMMNTFTFFCSVLAVARVLVYVYGYLPPISLFGRFSTGRLIIPGYDRVLAAPALVVLFGIYGPRLLGRLQVPPVIFPSLCVFIPLWMAMALGPTLRRWRLVGTHRIVNVPPMGAKRKRPNNDWKNVEIRLFGR